MDPIRIPGPLVVPPSKPEILLDIDDVCGDMVPTWMILHNWINDDCVDPYSIDSWDIASFVRPSVGQKVYELLAFPHFYDLVKPYPGFTEGVQALRQNYRVRYASACVPGTIDQKLAWVLKHDPGATYKDVHFGYDKWMLRGDVLVDDGPHNLIAFPGRTIRFRQKWNHGAAANAHVSSWAEMPGALIRAFETEKYVEDE